MWRVGEQCRAARSRSVPASSSPTSISQHVASIVTPIFCPRFDRTGADAAESRRPRAARPCIAQARVHQARSSSASLGAHARPGHHVPARATCSRCPSGAAGSGRRAGDTALSQLHRIRPRRRQHRLVVRRRPAARLMYSYRRSTSSPAVGRRGRDRLAARGRDRSRLQRGGLRVRQGFAERR